MLQRCLDVVKATLNILFNCSQYDSNRVALNGLRVVNDLLQFTKADVQPQQLKTSAMLTIAFLIDEENCHLIHMDSKCGVVRFILDKLESTQYSPEHRSGGFSTLELLRCIYRVAMNDANKVILVYDGVLSVLSAIMCRKQDTSQHKEEQLLTARIVWCLAFVEDNRHIMMMEQDLVDCMRANADSDNTQLAQCCQGALFELEKTAERLMRALERQCHSPARAGRNARGICWLSPYLLYLYHLLT